MTKGSSYDLNNVCKPRKRPPNCPLDTTKESSNKGSAYDLGRFGGMTKIRICVNCKLCDEYLKYV